MTEGGGKAGGKGWEWRKDESEEGRGMDMMPHDRQDLDPMNKE